MIAIHKLFQSKSGNSDILHVIQAVLDQSKVRYTQSHLSKNLENHVEYPSLLSIHDVLADYGIESTAIRKGNYAYSDFETPFICSIQQEYWSTASFTVVENAEQHAVTYLDPIDKKAKTISLEDFEKIDKGIVLLLDGDHAKNEKNYAENRSKEKTGNIMQQIPVLLAGLSLLISIVYLLLTRHNEDAKWISLAFLINGAVGLSAGVLLLWHDIDAHNPFLKEVCGGAGRKLNCNAVLTSKGANFLGISWSVWGFTYFATFFISQFLFIGTSASVSFWSLASLFVAPYIFYSLYYQSRIIKQWCPLCLAVQAVLFVNAIFAGLYLIENDGFLLQLSWYGIASTLLLGGAILLGTFYLIPILKQARDSRQYEKKWKKLRYHPDIFQSLLDKSTHITAPVGELGIVVGNPLAKREIVKVCNPYCGPCSDAHPELEHIIQHNPNVRLRIIFTANGEENDVKTAPVAHLLAIEEKEGRERVHQALDDWYLTSQKDYKLFSSKYPMNGEVAKQKEKIIAMKNWCDEMKIRATPTIYIDGAELPETYRIDELKNLL